MQSPLPVLRNNWCGMVWSPGGDTSWLSPFKQDIGHSFFIAGAICLFNLHKAVPPIKAYRPRIFLKRP
jgi:hypothetical protein